MKRDYAKTSGTRGWILALLLTVAWAALPQKSYAISWLTWYAQDYAIRYASSKGTLTDVQEARAQAINDALYYSEATAFPLSAIGQTFIDGSFAPYETDTPGQVLNLAFEYINPANGATVSDPLVAEVVYEAITNPADPTDWVVIGQSTDSTSDFAISWQSSGFEPIIEAIPYDSSGAPIVISGVDGDNSAVGLDGVLYLPESSQTSLLLGLGIVGLLGLRRCAGGAGLRP
jgi:hypothetical protein